MAAAMARCEARDGCRHKPRVQPSISTLRVDRGTTEAGHFVTVRRCACCQGQSGQRCGVRQTMYIHMTGAGVMAGAPRQPGVAGLLSMAEAKHDGVGFLPDGCKHPKAGPHVTKHGQARWSCCPALLASQRRPAIWDRLASLGTLRRSGQVAGSRRREWAKIGSRKLSAPHTANGRARRPR
jgi:hypothetical protein